MLRCFKLKNYKNFKNEIDIDFENIAGYQFNTDCLEDGLISKMMIYGRNATGKTNLGKALMDITNTIFGERPLRSRGILLNADSMEDAATFCYVFKFGDDNLQYEYSRFSEFELKEERFLINGIEIFNCDFHQKMYNFKNLSYIHAETANVELYLESLESEGAEEIIEPKLPFLKWLIGNIALVNGSILLRLVSYVRRMNLVTAGNSMWYRFRGGKDSFFDILEKQDRLLDFEEFLNEMGIECKLLIEKLPDGQKNLYFIHERQLVPFYENASSGTLALVELYRRFVLRAGESSLIYLDEFDAFYHYEMSENVVRYFKKKYPKCQIIMTSHNTNLMTNKIMRPDCLFILSRSGTLTALCNATERELREGHNLEKMYISGEFEKYE